MKKNNTPFSIKKTPILRTPKLNGDDPNLKREEIRAYFHHSLDCYESLFETLANEDAYFKKSIALRHPLIFYYGHTATFFINKLILAGLISDRINPHFESLFAIGVDEMNWDDMDQKNYSWPKVNEVKIYRNLMRSKVDQLIQSLPLTLPITWESPWWPILMGIEHERIHLETSSVLIRQHQLSYVKPNDSWPICPDQNDSAPTNKLITVPARTVELNKTKSNQTNYGWDNEYGYHTSKVESFQASQYLVSNQEFLEFVESDGYQNKNYWDEDGWSWKTFTHTEFPTFWIKRNKSWFLRAMTEEILMPWTWPVEVNYHEAKAFCQWKKAKTKLNYRLPTEDEWFSLYEEVKLSDDLNNIKSIGNLHLDYFASSTPVNRFKQGEFYDVVGNVWQWTETSIYPFEGFEVHPLYDDFSTPTFDNKHNLIKGGSWISCGNESIKNSRYAFRRHFFQHAGFRYVVSDFSQPIRTSLYETDKLLSEYAEFHYGETYFDVPNFPKALVDLASKYFVNRSLCKALDLGCASGRASFELARYFDKVLGIDFSARFIGQGVKLIQDGVLYYTRTEEGDLLSYKESRLSHLDLNSYKHKIEFFQGDACNLKPHFVNFDFVLAANLIDRLYDPKLFLNDIHKRINKNGLLMISSPYTWLTEHTKKENWIGGYKKDGEPISTFDGLNAILKANFRLLEKPISVPFVIRETKRKFQHSLSEVTIWERL